MGEREREMEIEREEEGERGREESGGIVHNIDRTRQWIEYQWRRDSGRDGVGK